jgi:2-C-methyl-D-erythritol 4-phosphate cytidylyltransferase/2-C-methyl-D-erythritol 2,4-cyclodiphosphate synthase
VSIEPAYAILVAAGRGERMGAARPKAFVELRGETLLRRAARPFDESPQVAGIVAVVPAAEVETARGQLAGVHKLHAVVAGGERRQDSVRAGLDALPPAFAGVVLVHDAARPLVPRALVEAVAAAAREVGAAVPVVPLVDTIKEIEGGRVVRTLERDRLAGAQTPQGFRLATLVRACREAARSGSTVTDEALAVERAGGEVAVVPGSERNRKLTTPEDLEWARRLLDEEAGAAQTPSLRVGTGFDAHRLVPGRPLRLGGVTVPFERGLAGHSDGDCVIHAVCDALLGAAAAGDMGEHFPSRDQRWREADSRVFLRETARIVKEAGFDVASIDATVVAQAPVLAPHLPAMRAEVASALSLPPALVSVKAKSTDGLGALGRGEGIAAQATALLVRRSNP